MLALSRYAAAERHTKEVASGKAKRVARGKGLTVGGSPAQQCAVV